jgi:hypothetical protein
MNGSKAGRLLRRATFPCRGRDNETPTGETRGRSTASAFTAWGGDLLHPHADRHGDGSFFGSANTTEIKIVYNANGGVVETVPSFDN